MRKLSASIIVIFFLLGGGSFLVLQASAHTTGSFWQTKAGNYYADVGYDPTVFVAGSYVRFDFGLLKNTADIDSIPFAEVWVRIKMDKNTLLATGIRKQPIGPTTLLYTFASPGPYSLEASFRDTEGNELAAASFPFDVVPSDQGNYLNLYGMYVISFLLGGMVCMGVLYVFHKKTQ